MANNSIDDRVFLLPCLRCLGTIIDPLLPLHQKQFISICCLYCSDECGALPVRPGKSPCVSIGASGIWELRLAEILVKVSKPSTRGTASAKLMGTWRVNLQRSVVLSVALGPLHLMKHRLYSVDLPMSLVLSILCHSKRRSTH
jgi:hypothetical protein